MKFVYIPLVLTVILSLNLSAQTKENQESDIHHHAHHRYEIGLAVSPVFLLKEKEFATGMHLHFLRNLPHSKFAFGLGYERIFDEHEHNTFGLEAIYRPVEKLNLSLSPGLTFEKGSSKPDLALHTEVSYEFEIGEFHLGPAFEIAIAPEDIHFSLGIHLGIGF